MAEMLEQTSNLESTTVAINRTSTTVKGGRRMSFSALVVVGDRRGNVSYGYGKAPGVPVAIEKAQKDARKRIKSVTLLGRTIPHPVTGRYGASSVRLIPAAPGTGVVAGGTVRAMLEMAGVQDCLSKVYGSSNQANLCKAVMDGLQQLRSREQIAAMRGVEIEASVVDEKLRTGEKYMVRTSGEGTKKAEAPRNTVGQKQGRGGSRGGRGGGGGGRGGNFGGGRRDSNTPAGAAAAPGVTAGPDSSAVTPDASANPTAPGAQ